MTTRRQFMRNAAAAGIVVATSSRALSTTQNARIKKVVRREETVLRLGGNGDDWHMSWAADDRQYTGFSDGSGFSRDFKSFYNSGMCAISNGPKDAQFEDLANFPLLGFPTQKATDTRYYNFGTLALDGRLYQYMSTFNRAPAVNGPKDLPEANDSSLRFVGTKLIYSPDNGRTWCNQDGSTPVVWEDWNSRSRRSMAFFEEDQDAFSLLTVLQMGKNYEHNRDGFIYAYAPNGNTDGTMNELVMFRVPKSQLLDRRAYEYFAGPGSDGKAKWSKDIMARRPVHTFPRGWVGRRIHPYAWHPSVVYNAPLGVYLMTNWGMGIGTESDTTSGLKKEGMWFAKPSYLGFWISESPWGPWTQIHEESAWLPGGDLNARAYQPQIAPKWIAPDGKSFWLVWTDYQVKDQAEYKKLLEPFERKLPENRTLDEWAEMDRLMRKYKPYYGFNAQRIDLI